MAPVLYDKKPQPGDLIEIDRGVYQHWAVYVGDGFVVHLAPPSEVADAQFSSLMSAIYEYAFIKKEKLWDVVGTDKWTINNILDKKHEPRPSDIIVKEACSLVGQRRPYSVFSKNCEHFVTELRYGKAESRQVVQAALAAGAATVGVLGLVALAAALFQGSKNEDKSKH